MIHLYFFTDNFGDELSPYIVRKLTGQDIVFSYPLNRHLVFRNLMSSIKSGLKGSFHDIKRKLSFTSKPVILAIGSLLEYAGPRSIIWGTGMAKENIMPTGGKFLCTRGKLSRKVLVNNGICVQSDNGGDPALLLPLIYSPSSNPIPGKIGIVCHNSNIDYVKNLNLNKNIEIIGLKTSDVETVIDKIVSCSFIYTTSLHGLIVSHAYGIPALWVEVEELEGGWFKFHDYLSSVDLELYSPLKLDKIIKGGFDESQFQDYPLTIDSFKLETIQRELLRLAPFEVKGAFKSL